MEIMPSKRGCRKAGGVVRTYFKQQLPLSIDPADSYSIPSAAAPGQVVSVQQGRWMTMDVSDVAEVLQSWISDGHTLPDCLASLAVCAREGRLTPSNKLVTMDAVRAGFQLWRARREERAALLGMIASWSESQHRGGEVGKPARQAPSAGHVVPSGGGGRGGHCARSAPASVAVGGNAAPCITAADGPPPTMMTCAQERTEGGNAGRPAAATLTETTRAKRGFPRRPQGAAETGPKRPCAGVSGVAQSNRAG